MQALRPALGKEADGLLLFAPAGAATRHGQDRPAEGRWAVGRALLFASGVSLALWAVLAAVLYLSFG